jgi:DMSO/TMAO reductase YedYZ heme-binding membrane subunit
MMAHWINGWRLTALLAGLLALMVAGIVAADDFSIDGIRAGIRGTARTSLLLFLPVFAAGALARLHPGSFARWLRHNRRHLGLGFAASHGLHAALIVVFALRDPALFRSMTSTGTLLSGGLAYVFILLMAATSFDRAVTWLGPRRWRILHWCGAWYIALSFVVTNAKRAPEMPLYWLPVALVLAAMLLRWTVAWRERRSARAAARTAQTRSAA